MSSNSVHKYVDVEIEEVEKRLSSIYQRASNEVEKKAEAYFKKYEKANVEKLKLVKEGKLTQAEYNAWRQGQVMTGKKWSDFKASIADSLGRTNQQAVDIVNGKLPEIYAASYNDVGAGAEALVKGYSFNLVDRDTVAYLAKKDRNLLPYKTIDGKKMARWNEQKISSEVMQSVLQGESVGKLAKRFRDVTDMNKASSIRNARTAFTSAESKGDFDGMHRLSDDGLMVKKEWLATHDDRTRQSHLDFEAMGPIDIDEEFTDGLLYPADPNGEPEEVYNCRCTMKTKIIGYNGHLF